MMHRVSQENLTPEEAAKYADQLDHDILAEVCRKLSNENTQLKIKYTELNDAYVDLENKKNAAYEGYVEQL